VVDYNNAIIYPAFAYFTFLTNIFYLLLFLAEDYSSAQHSSSTAS
jgi:hypothetical protein